MGHGDTRTGPCPRWVQAGFWEAAVPERPLEGVGIGVGQSEEAGRHTESARGHEGGRVQPLSHLEGTRKRAQHCPSPQLVGTDGGLVTPCVAGGLRVQSVGVARRGWGAQGWPLRR